MSRYRLSAAAERDIRDLWSYIAADNPEAADRFVDRLYDCFLRVAASPQECATYPDPRVPCRYSIVRPCVVFFAEREDSIEIVRVLHGRRDIPQQFD